MINKNLSLAYIAFAAIMIMFLAMISVATGLLKVNDLNHSHMLIFRVLLTAASLVWGICALILWKDVFRIAGVLDAKGKNFEARKMRFMNYMLPGIYAMYIGYKYGKAEREMEKARVPSDQEGL